LTRSRSALEKAPGRADLYWHLQRKISLFMNETITPTYLDADSAPLLFTDAAAGKVRELIAEEGNPQLKLRVYISGGGCSGFQYGFTFDEARAEDDFAVDKEGVTLLVDPLSLQYLAGAEIDYSESLTGAQFVIRNPNAKTTCGCGSSFTV
jgi:iron-sulfur cluster insertion protein